MVDKTIQFTAHIRTCSVFPAIVLSRFHNAITLKSVAPQDFGFGDAKMTITRRQISTDIIKIAVEYSVVKLQVIQAYFRTNYRTLAMSWNGGSSTDNYAVLVYVTSTIPLFVGNSRRKLWNISAWTPLTSGRTLRPRPVEWLTGLPTITTQCRSIQCISRILPVWVKRPKRAAYT